jgi:hypothetical protein
MRWTWFSDVVEKYSLLAPPAYVVGILTHSPSSANEITVSMNQTRICVLRARQLTLHQFFVDALTQSFDICGVNEELPTMRAKRQFHEVRVKEILTHEQYSDKRSRDSGKEEEEEQIEISQAQLRERGRTHLR